MIVSKNSTWERYEAGVTRPKVHFIELFCIKTNQDFNLFKETINNLKKAPSET